MDLTDEDIARIPWNQVKGKGFLEKNRIFSLPRTYLNVWLPNVYLIWMTLVDKKEIALYVAMGLHPRLGEKSLLMRLDKELVQKIIEATFRGDDNSCLLGGTA